MTTFVNGALYTFSWPPYGKSIRELWKEGHTRSAYFTLCPCKNPNCIIAYNKCDNPSLMPLLDSNARLVSAGDWTQIMKSILL